MRKLFTLAFSLLIAFYATAATVTIEKARLVADNYFRHYTGKTGIVLHESSTIDYNGTLACYIFNYEGGGFVVVPADDVAAPILAQGNTGTFELIPPVQFWLDAMNEEISALKVHQFDNSANLSAWNKLLNNDFDRSTLDVGPLLTTTWDQGQWYNYYCPPASGGPGGKAWAGCVATAMGQIMKFYNYPEKGFGSNSYYEDDNGILSADFGNTTYGWASMGNTATSGNYQAIATLLYHLGISVFMDYAYDGSGAFSEDVSWSLTNFFNYDPLTISYNDKANFTNPQWVAMLKADLDLGHPVYYAGSTATNAGHAWVCDGYRTSDDKFHMNWGWSGSSNGYFSVTANMSAGGWTFTKNFRTVTGIKPADGNVFVRIQDIRPNQMLGKWKTLPVNVSMVTGTASLINLYIDNTLVFTSTQSSFTTDLNLTAFSMGNHILKAEAVVGSDTGYHIIPVVITDWESQNSNFPRPSRGIDFIHAVDNLVVWATAYDGSGDSEPVQEVTKTIDGGANWTSYTINNTTGLDMAMIYALDANTAYVPMYKTSGANPQGIYVTTNGGTTWTRQSTAAFNDTYSFPNMVHFFNSNDGVCMGDPKGRTEFEIYTTTNGGTTWTLVPGSNIPDPLNAGTTNVEFGVVGYYSAIGDNIWFGTSKGRVYRSNDKGLTWNVSSTALGAKYVDVEFADELHGLAQDKSEGTTGTLNETFDGGVTWSAVTTTGQVGTNDLVYVPGTANTWVTTEAGGSNGAFYSFDGGHTWSTFEATPDYQFLAVDFSDAQHGWSGYFTQRDLKEGMFGFTGSLIQINLVAITNLSAVVYGNDVILSWTAPAGGSGTLTGYKVYRNDVLIATVPATQTDLEDLDVVNGQQNYCVVAAYDLGDADPVCAEAWITVGTVENATSAISIYPNPATGYVMVESAENITRVRILNMVGNEVYHHFGDFNSLKVMTTDFDPGMYIMQVTSGNRTVTRKLTIR